MRITVPDWNIRTIFGTEPMTEYFYHGIEVHEVETGPRVIQSPKSSVIGIIGTAPEADDDMFPYHKPVLLHGSLKEAAELGEAGTLLTCIQGIFDQIGAYVVVIRVPEGETEEETMNNIIGGVAEDTDEYKGVHAFLSSGSYVHVIPRILIAPYFTHRRGEENANSDSGNAVIAALLPIAERLRAIVIAEGGPGTSDKEAIDASTDFTDSRLFRVDPWVINYKQETVPPSPYVAGLIAKSDVERGFWWSPSNREIKGIIGISRPIDFALGDTECRANYLNANNIATIIRHNGLRLWGNRTCSSDPKWAYLSVRRTADMINEAILKSHLWAVDRNITRTYLEEVTESVNSYLAHLKAKGAILGGRCYADPDLNSPAQIAQGVVYFDFDFTAPYPAERIVFKSHLIDGYIKEIL